MFYLRCVASCKLFLLRKSHLFFPLNNEKLSLMVMSHKESKDYFLTATLCICLIFFDAGLAGFSRIITLGNPPEHFSVSQYWIRDSKFIEQVDICYQKSAGRQLLPGALLIISVFSFLFIKNLSLQLFVYQFSERKWA